GSRTAWPASGGTSPPPGSAGRRGSTRRSPFFPPPQGGLQRLGPDVVDAVADLELGGPEEVAVRLGRQQSGQAFQVRIGGLLENLVDAGGLGFLVGGQVG